MWCFRRFWYSKIPVITGQISVIENEEDYVVPPNLIIKERMELVSVDEYKVKNKLWYPGEKFHELSREEALDVFYSRPTKLWIWIGGEDNEAEIMDMTEEVDEYLVEGNKINLQLLKRINPSIIKWTYYCSETFEIIDFPSEDIIIKNDSNIKEDKED